VKIGEVQESGDWAYEVGTFSASAPDGKVLNAGKYIVIWKRESTGEWKTHRDIFNWDIPPSQSARRSDMRRDECRAQGSWFVQGTAGLYEKTISGRPGIDQHPLGGCHSLLCAPEPQIPDAILRNA
jgi:hypothetical protein